MAPICSVPCPGPVLFVIGGLVVAGALLTAWLVSRRPRDDDAGTVDDAGTRIAPETSPPGGISPALAGALLGGGARNYHVIATLVDIWLAADVGARVRVLCGGGQLL